MAKNFSGRDYKLYLATSSPATADISTSYTVVGYLTSVSVSQSRNAIDKSNKDDGDDSSFIGGRRNITVSGSALWDHAGDTGQAMLKTTIEASAGQVWFLISTNTSGDQEFYGSGILTQYNVSAPDEAVSTVDFTIQVTGALSEVTGDSTT